MNAPGRRVCRCSPMWISFRVRMNICNRRVPPVRCRCCARISPSILAGGRGAYAQCRLHPADRRGAWDSQLAELAGLPSSSAWTCCRGARCRGAGAGAHVVYAAHRHQQPQSAYLRDRLETTLISEPHARGSHCGHGERHSHAGRCPRMRASGVHTFLVGEAFMKALDPGANSLSCLALRRSMTSPCSGETDEGNGALGGEASSRASRRADTRWLWMAHRNPVARTAVRGPWNCCCWAWRLHGIRCSAHLAQGTAGDQ